MLRAISLAQKSWMITWSVMHHLVRWVRGEKLISRDMLTWGHWNEHVHKQIQNRSYKYKCREREREKSKFNLIRCKQKKMPSTLVAGRNRPTGSRKLQISAAKKNAISIILSHFTIRLLKCHWNTKRQTWKHLVTPNKGGQDAIFTALAKTMHWAQAPL